MSKKQFFWEQAKWMVVIVLYLDASGIYMKEHFYKGKPDLATMPHIDMHRRFFGERFLDMAWATLAMIYFPIQNSYTQLSTMSVALGGGAPKVWTFPLERDGCPLTESRIGLPSSARISGK
jgi:hypothetical protein